MIGRTGIGPGKPLLQRAVACSALAIVAILATASVARAQDVKNSYPSMAPLDQYLMEREAEIALARSAAPTSISHDAEILVLGRHGYEAAAKGTNGFVCLVQRSWAAGLTTPNSGIPDCAHRSASTRRPCDPISRRSRRRRNGPWPGDPRLRCTRRHQIRHCEQCDPDARDRRDVVHDVEGRVPERP